MPLTLFVGRPGTGKTIELVRRLLDARDLGRDLYANFLLGERVDGYIVPTCPVFTLGMADPDDWTRSTRFALVNEQVACLGDGHRAHEPVTGHFVAWAAEYERRAGPRALRHGTGFLPDPKLTVLEEWEQVIAIRVARDAFGSAHKLRLTRNAEYDAAENPDVPRWVALPTCRVYDCSGCSAGVTIGLDELNLWAPSRLWQEMGIDVLNRWAYIRKDGLDIYASAQHEGRVDVVARQVTNDIYTCNVIGNVMHMFGRDVHMQVFTRQRWEPAMLTERNRRGGGEGAQNRSPMGVLDWDFSLWRSMARAARAYDTYEHVRPSEHLSKGKTATGNGRTVSAEQRTRITAHLAGKHKKAAATCYVCQVASGVTGEGEGDDLTANEVPAA